MRRLAQSARHRRPAVGGEQLDQAAHPTDLVPGGRIWVNLDLAQQGIGSASCGPGVLPGYRLDPVPATFAVRLLPQG